MSSRLRTTPHTAHIVVRDDGRGARVHLHQRHHRLVAAQLVEGGCDQMARMCLQPRLAHAAQKALQALLRKIERGRGMDVGNVLVPQRVQLLHGQHRAGFIVEVEPRKVFTVGAAAIGHKRHTLFLQVADACVLSPRVGNDVAVHPPLAQQTLVSRQFPLGRRRGNQHVDARLRAALCEARDHLQEMRVAQVPGAGGKHDADGFCTAHGQQTRCAVGLVAVVAGCGHHALARAGTHVGIPVERAAHGGLGQTQQKRKLFEVHVLSSVTRSRPRPPGRRAYPVIVCMNRAEWVSRTLPQTADEDGMRQ